MPMQAVPEAFARHGWMPTSNLHVRALDGNNLLIRGTMRNPYDEAISGVRLYVVLLSEGDKPRELDRLSREVDTQLEPRGEAALRIEMPTVHARGIRGMGVYAFGIRRGETELSAPPELDDVSSVSAVTVAPSIPYPSTPVSSGFTGVSF